MSAIVSVRHALRILGKGKQSLRGTDLINRIRQKKTELSIIEVRRGLKGLHELGEIKASLAPSGEPLSNVGLHLAPEPVSKIEEEWQVVLENADLPTQDQEALMPLHKTLDGFSSEEFQYLLAGLLRLREEQAQWYEQPAFLVSAKYLLGSSKLLSSLSGRAIKTFGIETERFTAHPRYVVAGGCANPELVVLIENPAAFELAMSSNAAKRCAFIATFGFGLSKQGEDYGNQLADMVKSRFNEAITLIREGSDCPPAKVLLNHPNMAFWGDLDIAGMQIFERIAAAVPQIQLSALYLPMINAIQSTERRHPYVMAAGSGKPGQKLFKSIRQDIQQMLAYCERYAVDQEIVLLEEIELLAARTLDKVTHST